MRKFLAIALVLCISGVVYAQQEREIGSPDPQRLGIETAQQLIKEVSVDKFEQDGFWMSTMSPDNGYTTTRLFRGSPAGKQPIPDEEGMDIQDIHVLGTRVDYLRRGYHDFTIYPSRPIPIEGITKTVSVWVAGRNFNHSLYLLIQDFYGRNYQFYMGRLNFIGWQKMTVAIPPAPEDGMSGVVQRSSHHQGNFGIKIMGFRVEVDPMQARGSYYIYFDDLRAETDLFSEHHRDPDDMVDGW